MIVDPDNVSPETWVVTGGRPGAPGEPLNLPIAPASTFLAGGSLTYARDDGSQAWAALESVVGGLERGTAVAFASGMAAAQAAFDLVPIGGHLAVAADCYHGVRTVVDAGVQAGRWTAESIPVRDTARWLEAGERCDLLWLDSPSNPLLEVADLEAIGMSIRREGSLLVVDNTFATPLRQRPLELGADLVVHSATKLIGGHSDLLMGVAVAGRTDLADRLSERRRVSGSTPGSLETFLALRGIRTLPLRLERAEATARWLRDRLAEHPAVARVRYPSDKHHPDGFGTVVSFEMERGEQAAAGVCDAVRLVRHATSLGGVESTLEQRKAPHGQDPLPAGLIRLSVGIEAPADLWRDLAQALEGR